jgi:[ribosomal protein S5]-alanine N-acetyltransferase
VEAFHWAECQALWAVSSPAGRLREWEIPLDAGKGKSEGEQQRIRAAWENERGCDGETDADGEFVLGHGQRIAQRAGMCSWQDGLSVAIDGVGLEPDDPCRELPVLETPRLVLRRMEESDAEDVYEYASDPAVAEHTSWEPHQSIDVSTAFAASQARGRGCAWGIVHRTDQKVIGTCGIVRERAPYRGEINFALSRKYWNQGYMTEAVREVIGFGFEVLGLHRIQARCKVANVGSARVMEKAGMTFEGVLREYSFSKGEYLDLKMYSILRREWRS